MFIASPYCLEQLWPQPTIMHPCRRVECGTDKGAIFESVLLDLASVVC